MRRLGGGSPTGGLRCMSPGSRHLVPGDTSGIRRPVSPRRRPFGGVGPFAPVRGVGSAQVSRGEGGGQRRGFMARASLRLALRSARSTSNRSPAAPSSPAARRSSAVAVMRVVSSRGWWRRRTGARARRSPDLSTRDRRSADVNSDGGARSATTVAAMPLPGRPDGPDPAEPGPGACSAPVLKPPRPAWRARGRPGRDPAAARPGRRRAGRGRPGHAGRGAPPGRRRPSAGYTERFDGVTPRARPGSTPTEVAAARADADPDLVEALVEARDAIEAFHQTQLRRPPPPRAGRHHRRRVRPGPVARAGCYVPGGRAAYPSTVLMTAVPARVAGVDEVVLCVPPGSRHRSGGATDARRRRRGRGGRGVRHRRGPGHRRHGLRHRDDRARST